MLMRKWFHGIAPIVISPSEVPTWITLSNITLQLMTPEGVSWIASNLGKPSTKFTREGLTVKICILCNEGDAYPESLHLVMGELGEIDIGVGYPASRAYKGNPKPVNRKVWKVKVTSDDQPSLADDVATSGNAAEPSFEGEGAPDVDNLKQAGEVAAKVPMGMEVAVSCQSSMASPIPNAGSEVNVQVEQLVSTMGHNVGVQSSGESASNSSSSKDDVGLSSIAYLEDRLSKGRKTPGRGGYSIKTRRKSYER
ncbi:hypothetical protein LINPERPRIM_LOCUS38100 [Linum perenne]